MFAGRHLAIVIKLIVSLESNPVCRSNMSDGSSKDSSSCDGIIWMRCSVSFSTVDHYPKMEWIQHHKDIQLIRNDSVTITTNSTLISILNVSINSIENGSYFSCITTFKPYNGSIKTIASNIPDFRFIWKSKEVIFQESSLSADNHFDVKDILMSSEFEIATTVTASIIAVFDSDSSSNYWCKFSLIFKWFLGIQTSANILLCVRCDYATKMRASC